MSESRCQYARFELKRECGNVLIINVHIPQDNSGPEFDALRAFVFQNSTATIVRLGDFNAHIGRVDLTNEDKLYIGPKLYYDHCNENGEELKNIVHAGNLRINNYWSRSPSVFITWKSGKMKSQIDHILSNYSNVRLSQIIAIWNHNIATDQSLLMGDMDILPDSPGIKRKIEDDPSPHKITKRQHVKKWDLKKLEIPAHAQHYQKKLVLGAAALLETADDDTSQEPDERESLWQRTSKLILRTANATLPKTDSPLTPEQYNTRS